jgi:hypothetical protein
VTAGAPSKLGYALGLSLSAMGAGSTIHRAGRPLRSGTLTASRLSPLKAVTADMVRQRNYVGGRGGVYFYSLIVEIHVGASTCKGPFSAEVILPEFRPPWGQYAAHCMVLPACRCRSGCSEHRTRFPDAKIEGLSLSAPVLRFTLLRPNEASRATDMSGQSYTDTARA